MSWRGAGAISAGVCHCIQHLLRRDVSGMLHFITKYRNLPQNTRVCFELLNNVVFDIYSHVRIPFIENL